MSFEYVDRILEYEPHRFMRGLKNVTRNEEYFYRDRNGQRFLNPAIVCEAGLQLGSWLCMVSTSFVSRPVLLSDERTEFPHQVYPGDQIEFVVRVEDIDDEVVSITGEGWVGDRQVLLAHLCRGYLQPLRDFSDPRLVKKRFQTLHRPEFKDLSPCLSFDGLKDVGANSDDVGAYPFYLIDEVLKKETSNSMRFLKRVSMQESYFEGHFHRKPVMPGVIQLSMISEAAQLLGQEIGHENQVKGHLILSEYSDVRFRKFIEPGDELVVDVQSKSKLEPGKAFIVDGHISSRSSGKRMMSAKLHFDFLPQ